MKRLFVAGAAIACTAGALLLQTATAEAVVCAKGVVRAGCAGPNGAVGVRRPVAAPVVVAPRPVVVAPRPAVVAPGVNCAYVNGARVCR